MQILEHWAWLSDFLWKYLRRLLVQCKYDNGCQFTFTGNSRDRLPQETFVNCADVVITRRDGTLSGGLTMPDIPPQAYEPIPSANHTLGRGQLVGNT